MIWFIRAIGLLVIVIALLQIKRSTKYPTTLSEWNIDKKRINQIVWIARVGGLFGLLIGIWMLFFAKV